MSDCLVQAPVQSAVRFRTYMRAGELRSVSEAGKCTNDIHGVILRHCKNMLRSVTLLNVPVLHAVSLIVICGLDVVFSVVKENCF